ncbi:D(1) dopamine receptor-like [Clytia hemisphaerica]|uniref:G-protein coupled receptors family 1 profile domain-containing protein n=1 Tax=Clytia hemisphaerica TaxID=252671 RepID=A0A7M5VFV5_9CNID
MNVTSCNDIMQMMQPTGSVSELIYVILPNICGIIESINASMVTFEERIFYDHCCDPIPFMILNKTVNPNNETHPDILIRDVCNYMKDNRSPQEEQLYRDVCLSANHHAAGVLNPAWRLLTFIILSVLTPIGFFANVLILMTVYKIKHLRNTTGYFICNLAVSDLLVIFQMLLFVTMYTSGAMSDASPRVQSFFFPTIDVVIGSASLLHVTAVTMERGIAVSMPLRYPRYLNERTANRTIVGIWIYCLVLLVMGLLRIPIVSDVYNSVFFFIAATLSFFIPCILVLVSYGFILVSALKNMKMEKKISKVIVVISTMDQENLEKVASMRPARFREIKIAFNVAIMTVPFVCGWGYFMTCNTYEIVAGKDITGFQNWLIPFVPFVISCLNPLTYLMFTRSLRKSSLVLLSRSKLCKKLTQSLIKREGDLTSMSFVINDRNSLVVGEPASQRQSANLSDHNDNEKKPSESCEQDTLIEKVELGKGVKV